MRFLRHHKILVSVLTAVVLLFASVFGYVYHTLGKLNFVIRGPVEPAAVAATVSADETQTEPVEIEAMSLPAEASAALLDADAQIRRNLDDSKKWYSPDVVNVVLFGYDYGSKSYPYGRSDAMLVLSLNKAVQKVKVISLSRTAYAAIPGHKNTRLSHAHGYGGANLAVQAIELNYKFRVDNFVSCSFDGFRQIIDLLGGVPVTLTDAEARVLHEKFSAISGAGRYTLNGEQALLYARTRKIDNDRARTGRQRKIILSLVEKARRLSPLKMTRLLDQVLPLVTTDFTRSGLLLQLANVTRYLQWDFEQYLIPAKPYRLVLRDEFEVILMDWPHEVDDLHELMYESVIPSYEET